MKPLHKLSDFDFDLLKSIIDNQIEESIHIEFKRSEAISRTPSVKKEISKDVASFANSNGGIIIYGIEEKNHRADSFSFINGEEFSKEFLEQVINSTIHREIEGLKIFPIRVDSDIQKSIYVLKIPVSSNAPHMSQDKRFYKRLNFESVMMEEYEVRALYGRKIKTELKISGLNVSVNRNEENEDDDETRFTIWLTVENIGETMVKDYRANIYFNGEIQNCNMNWEGLGQGKNYSYTLLDKGVKITNEKSIPIFPSEELDVLRVNLDVNNRHLESFINEFDLSSKIFYENETANRKFKSNDQMLQEFQEKSGSFDYLNNQNNVW